MWPRTGGTAHLVCPPLPSGEGHRDEGRPADARGLVRAAGTRSARCSRSASFPSRSRVPARSASGSCSRGEPRGHEEAAGLARAPRCRSRGWSRTATAPGVIDSVGPGSTRRGSAGGCGCTAPSPTGRSAPRPQLTVVPAEQAVDLPDGVSDEVGACLGIPGITAHRAVFADGPVAGRPCSCTACSAPSAPSPPSSPAGAARPSSGRSAAARTSTACVADRRPPVALDETDPAAADPGRTHPTASTGSSRSPSRTTSTSTPPSPEQHRHRRLRHPRRPARLPVLADAVRQRDHPAARQRRLPRRGQAAGGRRPHHGGRRRRAVDRHRGTAAARADAEAHDRVDAGARERVVLAIPH